MVKLPKVGDLIGFRKVWNLPIEGDRYPYGIVTSIRKCNNSDSLYDDKFYGTLAFPLTINHDITSHTKIFVVQWATSNRN